MPSKKQNRWAHECPVCMTKVKRLPQHLRTHKNRFKSEYQIHLWANYIRLHGITQYRGRDYKICPVFNCSVIAAEMALHLRHSHMFSNNMAQQKAKAAQKVKHCDWTIPEHNRTIFDFFDDDEDNTATEVIIEQPSSEGKPFLITDYTMTKDKLHRSIYDAEEIDQVNAEGALSDAPETADGRQRHPMAQLIDEYVNHLRGVWGGSVSKQRSLEYGRYIERFLCHFRLERHPERALDHNLVSRYIEHRNMGPAFNSNISVHLKRFGNFLVRQKMITLNDISTFSTEVSGLQKSLNKHKCVQRVKQASRLRHRAIAPNMNELYDHPIVVSAINRLRGGVNYQNWFDTRYLIAVIYLHSGARTGALENMTHEEIRHWTLELRDDIEFRVVSVTDHKTSALGPVDLPMSVAEHEALTSVSNFVLGEFPDSVHPFVTMGFSNNNEQGGKPYSTSRLAYEFRKAWSKTGMKEKYGTYTVTMNRKRIATTMSKKHPEMRELTSNHLKHSTRTDKTYYDLGTTPGHAVTIRTLMNHNSTQPNEPPPEQSDAQTSNISIVPPTDLGPKHFIVRPTYIGPKQSVVSKQMKPDLPRSDISNVPPTFVRIDGVLRRRVLPQPVSTQSAHAESIPTDAFYAPVLPMNPCPSDKSPPGSTGTPMPSDEWDSKHSVKSHTISIPSEGDFPRLRCIEDSKASECSEPPLIDTTLDIEQSSNRVSNWLKDISTVSLEEPPKPVPCDSNIQDTGFSEVFTSITYYTTPTGQEKCRRRWSGEGLEKFKTDWAFEIGLSAQLNKKPSIVSIKEKLAKCSELRTYWKFLSPQAIKDKIWVEAQRERRLNAPME